MVEQLTPRERCVLALIARGYTDRAIAAYLLISPDTVNSHVRHIFEKLGASSRANAVAIALECHLMTYSSD